MDPDDQALLVAEMGRPVDMDAIVNSADSPEVAAEIYVASLLQVFSSDIMVCRFYTSSGITFRIFFIFTGKID